MVQRAALALCSQRKLLSARDFGMDACPQRGPPDNHATGSGSRAARIGKFWL
jgi:hypothetical protein